MIAVILAGGYGKRLRPITERIPKNLIDIDGKPIIIRQIEWLKREGVRRFLLLTGWLSDKIVSRLGDGGSLGVEIKYSVEDEPLGTGGALKNAEDHLRDVDEFILVNGDIITNLSIYPLLDEVTRYRDVIGVLSAVPLQSPYGIIRFNRDGYISEFIEKPVLEDYWINAGVYVFRREVLDYLPEKGDLERTTLPLLASRGKLRIVKYMGVFWRSIDSHKDVELVSEALRTYKSLLGG